MTRTLTAFGAAALTLAALTGCFKVDYTTNASPAASPASDEMHKAAVFGLVEIDDPVPLNTICPNGVAKIHHETNFVQALISGCLGNLFNPSQVTVTCADGASYDLHMNDEGMVTGLANLDD